MNRANLKIKIDDNTIVVEDLSTPYSTVERSFKQKINKEKEDMNTTKQSDLIRPTQNTLVNNSQDTHSSLGHREHPSG